MQKKSVSQVKSFSLVFQGLVIGIIMIFPALLTMDISGVDFGFSFLLVAAVYYWPRAASNTWSLLSVFMLGLLYDMASANTLGMWSLAFLVLFMVLDSVPNVNHGIGRAMVGFSLSIGLCFFIVLLIGWISMGTLPQIGTLFLNALATIVIFPIIYWVHSIFNTMRGPLNASGSQS